ncbi:hypothetical protein KM043_006122 [Ampulex compressa]|nr:hypothetical protein KM043_006122 [Ampulex compressa]
MLARASSIGREGNDRTERSSLGQVRPREQSGGSSAAREIFAKRASDEGRGRGPLYRRRRRDAYFSESRSTSGPRFRAAIVLLEDGPRLGSGEKSDSGPISSRSKTSAACQLLSAPRRRLREFGRHLWSGARRGPRDADPSRSGRERGATLEGHTLRPRRGSSYLRRRGRSEERRRSALEETKASRADKREVAYREEGNVWYGGKVCDKEKNMRNRSAARPIPAQFSLISDVNWCTNALSCFGCERIEFFSTSPPSQIEDRAIEAKTSSRVEQRFIDTVVLPANLAGVARRSGPFPGSGPSAALADFRRAVRELTELAEIEDASLARASTNSKYERVREESTRSGPRRLARRAGLREASSRRQRRRDAGGRRQVRGEALARREVWATRGGRRSRAPVSRSLGLAKETERLSDRTAAEPRSERSLIFLSRSDPIYTVLAKDPCGSYGFHLAGFRANAKGRYNRTNAHTWADRLGPFATSGNAPRKDPRGKAPKQRPWLGASLALSTVLPLGRFFPAMARAKPRRRRSSGRVSNRFARCQARGEDRGAHRYESKRLRGASIKCERWREWRAEREKP